MKKKPYPLLQNFFLFLLFFIVMPGKLYAQTITIDGEANPDASAQEYYEASFDYSVNPMTNFTWEVNGGSIVSQGINPTTTVWVIIQWNSSPGYGYVSLYDDLQSAYSQKPTTIADGCHTANAGSDVLFCVGTPVTIGTSAVTGYTYAWSPVTGLNDPTLAQPSASPSQTTIYTLTMTPQNLITNGNFESGLTGFSTDYGIYPTGDGSCGGGQFGSIAIGSTKPVAVLCTINNHTAGGSNMLIIDGSCTADRRIWFQTVNVEPNTSYTFSGWTTSGTIDNNNAVYIPRLRVTINSTPIISNFSVPLSNCSWMNLSAGWTSGPSETTAVIEIYDDNLGSSGNDFCIDDLYLGNCTPTTDAVTVTYGGSPPSVSPAGPITYYYQYESPQDFTLTCNSASSYQWYKDNVIINGATSQTYTIEYDYLNTGIHYYKCVTSCGTSNVVSFDHIPCFDENDYSPTVQVIECESFFGTSPFYLQLPAPNLGAGTTSTWWTEDGVSGYYSINSTGQLSYTGSGTYTDGVYTKSSLANGTQTYLYYPFTVSGSCRPAKSANIIPDSIKPKIITLNTHKKAQTTKETKLLPNPANMQITVTAKSGIDRVEIINMAGIILRQIKATGSNSLSIPVHMLSPGIYSCKVVTKTGIEYLKLLIQR